MQRMLCLVRLVMVNETMMQDALLIKQVTSCVLSGLQIARPAGTASSVAYVADVNVSIS
jgi:hypothetical protein